ncbi:hypothetical protein [Spirosoma validum]|uniref:DUF3575 domain-containing protein n=1 Tax=Spirosoma validum TaxID=2771355 RepID=A0A927GF04_9BACT|nr:hypothetical protein [Spirosoma validum]MBD2755362.1 hypothetical protein [Spirosoma validum]
MKSLVILLTVCAIAVPSSAQVLPHRMRVGLSVDLLGATLGIGTQVHGSLRISDDYRAFDDKHTYINLGIGVGGGFTGGAGMVGQTVPHYVTYGIGRGRAMVEFGYAGVWMEKQTMETVMTSGGTFRDRQTKWVYGAAPLIGYRYTAYSGFLFRANLTMVLPGVSVGWIF